jgi:hypothetical protein
MWKNTVSQTDHGACALSAEYLRLCLRGNSLQTIGFFVSCVVATG